MPRAIDPHAGGLPYFERRIPFEHLISVDKFRLQRINILKLGDDSPISGADWQTELSRQTQSWSRLTRGGYSPLPLSPPMPLFPEEVMGGAKQDPTDE